MPQYIPPFTCDVIPARDQATVAPHGELDMGTVDVVENELRSLRAAGWSSIVLDLGGLSFMDSNGLHLAVRWSDAAASEGFEFSLLPGPPAVQRVFELAELSDHFNF